MDRFHFPSADWFDYSTIKEQCQRLGEEFVICFGTPGDMDFINSIGRARGSEKVLMDLVDRHPVYLELLNARFKFYYEMHERALQAGEGLIDIAQVGEDLGTQIGPMISHDIFEELFAQKYEAYFAMAHRYGAKTMMPMCGCVESFLPSLIDLGLDIFDVVQPTTPVMDIAALEKKYGNRLIFCGSVCVQTTLAFGKPEDVKKEVERRLRLFPKGGLFLGPTHAIQVGTPIENILSLYRTAGRLANKAERFNPHYIPLLRATQESTRQEIANPAYQELEAEKQKVKKQLQKNANKLAVVAEAFNKDGSVRFNSKRQRLLAERSASEEELGTIESKLQQTPARVSLPELTQGHERFKIIDCEAKNLFDLVQAMVWNARRTLIEMLRQHYLDERDLVNLLDHISRCHGWIKTTSEAIHVRLEAMDLPRYRAAQEELCNALTNLAAPLPNGKTFIFSVGDEPRQESVPKNGSNNN